MKKLPSVLVGLALIVGPAITAAPAMAVPNEDIKLVSSTPISEDDHIDSPPGSGAEGDPLELLPGATTDPTKIKEIDESEDPATILVDSDTGKILAARTEPTVLPFKITNVGPGCSAKDNTFCMKGANYYGFIGTGTLSATWKNVRWYHTGDKQGRVKTGGKWNSWQPKNRGVQFSKPLTVTGISRQ